MYTYDYDAPPIMNNTATLYLGSLFLFRLLWYFLSPSKIKKNSQLLYNNDTTRKLAHTACLTTQHHDQHRATLFIFRLLQYF